MSKLFNLLILAVPFTISFSCEEKEEKPKQEKEQISEVCECVVIQKEFLEEYMPLKKEELTARQNFQESLGDSRYKIPMVELESRFRRENQSLLEKIQELERKNDPKRKKCKALKNKLGKTAEELEEESRKCPQYAELEAVIQHF